MISAKDAKVNAPVMKTEKSNAPNRWQSQRNQQSPKPWVNENQITADYMATTAPDIWWSSDVSDSLEM